MHEFDETCYGKTLEELKKEYTYQIQFGNCYSLMQYIRDCIDRLKRTNKSKVDWYYD